MSNHKLGEAIKEAEELLANPPLPIKAWQKQHLQRLIDERDKQWRQKQRSTNICRSHTRWSRPEQVNQQDVVQDGAIQSGVAKHKAVRGAADQEGGN